MQAAEKPASKARLKRYNQRYASKIKRYNQRYASKSSHATSALHECMRNPVNQSIECPCTVVMSLQHAARCRLHVVCCRLCGARFVRQRVAAHVAPLPLARRRLPVACCVLYVVRCMLQREARASERLRRTPSAVEHATRWPFVSKLSLRKMYALRYACRAWQKSGRLRSRA
jgi:hypothetical protein